MKLRIPILDLTLIFIATIVCFIVIIKPNLVNSDIRSILIILLLLFISGYSLVAAGYPRKNDLDFIERLTLSFGFPLIGLAIVIVLMNLIPNNYLQILEKNFEMMLKAFTLIIIMLLIIAILRRKRVSDDNKYIYSKANEVKNEIKPELYNQSNINMKDKFSSKDRKDDEISNNNAFKINFEIEKNTNSITSFVTKDLFIIFLATIITIVFVVNPKLNETFLENIFVFILILFIPGYSLITALYPRKNNLDNIERVALSVGLSIGLAALFGLLLKYYLLKDFFNLIKFTHITNLNYISLTIILSSFTLIMLLIAFIRRRRVPESEKFYVNFGGFTNSIKGQFEGESRTSKILSIILIITILLAISTTAYIILKPKQGESFTEFYILGPNGQASDYPTNLTVGQNGTVIIGIVNHEYQTANYELVVRSNGTIMSQQNISLTNGNQTQIPYSFTAGSVGYKNIEFLLYKLPDTTNVYRSLHLYVNMT